MIGKTSFPAGTENNLKGLSVESPPDVLTHFLRVAEWRFRLSRGANAAGGALIAGTAASLFMLLLHPSCVWVFLPPFFLFSGALAGLLFPVSPLKVARLVDDRLGLCGRVMTASEIELSPERYEAAVIEVQRRDACEKLAEHLSAVPESLKAAVPIEKRLFLWSLFFYAVFAVLIFTVPASLFERRGPGQPPAAESDPPSTKQIEETLRRTRRVIEETAEANPRLGPVQRLRANSAKLAVSSEKNDLAETVFILKEWERALTEAIESIVAAEESRSDKIAAPPNQSPENTGAAAAAVLRGELGNVIRCRLDTSKQLAKNGGEGHAEPRGKRAWGKGAAERSSPSGTVPAEPYGENTDLHLSGATAPAQWRADPGDPSRFSSEPGRSERETGSFPERSELMPEYPLTKEPIPEERKELVKEYFDY